jgi:iron complex transport system permease protein
VSSDEPSGDGERGAGGGRRAAWLNPALLLGLAAVAVLALGVGSVSIPPEEIFRSLAGQSDDEVTSRILLGARLPRVLLAGVVGSALALAGLASQTLFRNPLASPSVIGVSNGAALGAVAGVLLGGRAGGLGYGVCAVLSVAGGLAVTAAVFVLGKRGRYFGHALLLAGIAIAALCSALTTGALYLAGERLPSVVFWLMGGLWQATWREVWLVAPVMAAGLAAMLMWSRALNVALLGERSAGDLGLDLPRLQRRLLVLIAVVTSVAVSVSGVIGFIGLIVPHLVRLVTGADHRRLIVPTVAGGAMLLIVADAGARTMAAPAEIPVGIFTAVTGAPVFLSLLQRRRPAGAP